MKTTLVLLILTTAFLFSCTKSSDQVKVAAVCGLGEDPAGIIHGKPLADSSPIAKHIVLIIQKFDGKGTMCTGTILNNQFVLTAAHCIDEAKSTTDLMIITNSDFSCDKGNNNIHQLKVVDYGISSKWATDNKLSGDIALLKFSGTLPADKAPVELATEILPQRAPILVAGFGKSESSQISDDKISLKYGYVKPDKDWETSRGAMFLKFDQSEKNGVCMGDSGGPAFQKQNNKWVQIGVASNVNAGLGVDSCFSQSQHSNLIYYSEWILKAKKAMGENQ